MEKPSGCWCIAHLLQGLGVVSLAAAAVVPALVPAQISYVFYLMFWVTMASAFNIIFGFTGYLPFGFVAFYGVGGYGTAICWSRLGIPIPAAIILGGALGTLLSLFFAPSLRLRGIYFAIVNFSCAMALRIVVANLPEEWTGGSLGISFSAAYQPIMSFYMMLILTALTVYVTARVSSSRLGIALRCIREDPDAADVIGINVPISRLKAWVLAALFSSLAGGIEAWHTAIIDPNSSFNLLITTKTIVYSMFGGLGSVVGPVIGAVCLYVLDDVVWGKFPLLNLMILGAMIVVLMLFLPRGVVGTLGRAHWAIRGVIK
jgi:branched-chain amino acid transport system permease protein